MKDALVTTWYCRHPIRWLLWPLSMLYLLVFKCRRWLYRIGVLRQTKLPVPVIIIGNISVGGTGKTPCVIWLANLLQQQGLNPGIVSRGYGGKPHSKPQLVTQTSRANEVGDEPIIISRNTGCPMAVFHRRAEAAQLLISQHQCDIIIADDGLQHYALARDIEIVLVDGQRLFGNELCLPAGPLREPISRLQSVDMVIINRSEKGIEQFSMSLIQTDAVNLVDPTIKKPLAEFISHSSNAIAGIGNPERFFTQLEQTGLTIHRFAFDDHHAFTANDVDFADGNAIIMTEKDAVKCHSFATKNMWYVPIHAKMSDNVQPALLHKLDEILAYYG